MKINGQVVVGKSYAFDGCHKIYVCENELDEKRLKRLGYHIYPIKSLENSWNISCSLRFIHNAEISKTYVPQFEEAVFE